MTIGEVAAKAGVHTSAIRFYEKTGLLSPPARTSGRRVYQSEVLHQLATISIYKELGFSLEEVGLLMNELPKEKAASTRWTELAQAKIREMEDMIVKATAVKKTLLAIMQCRCVKLEDCAKEFATSPRRRANLQLALPSSILTAAKNGKSQAAAARKPERRAN